MHKLMSILFFSGVLAFMPSSFIATAVAQDDDAVRRAQSLVVPVTGSGNGATFVGSLDIRRFANADGVVSAVGPPHSFRDQDGHP